MSVGRDIKFKLTNGKDLTFTHRIGSPKSSFEPKYHIFTFCEDEKHTRNFVGTNSEYFDIYRNGKHILAIKKYTSYNMKKINKIGVEMENLPNGWLLGFGNPHI
ncbi:hypothetical protein AAZX31_17G169400 [Glycine max]